MLTGGARSHCSRSGIGSSMVPRIPARSSMIGGRQYLGKMLPPGLQTCSAFAAAFRENARLWWGA